jgi:ethanolamine utilization protein EutA (predicted chaperonin)
MFSNTAPQISLSDQTISEIADRFADAAHDPLAVLADTGEISAQTIRNVKHLQRVHVREDVSTLHAYVVDHGVRPAVEGWNN